MGSWSLATAKLYDRFILKWKKYTDDHGIDVYSTRIVHVANFLAFLFSEGLSYSSINSARSALSAFMPLIDGVAVGSHPVISRLMKGVFQFRPVLPKYSETWDVGVVLKFLSSLPHSEELPFKFLTYRLVMLLCILTGQRGHALHLLKVTDIRLNPLYSRCVITYSDKHKTTRPGFHTKPSEICAYPHDRKLCLVDHIRRYLYLTASLRKDDKLFIGLIKPHNAISRSTFSRWVKDTLALAGIDTVKFSAHSTRAASTSAAAKGGTPMELILKAAAWSSESTFQRFYNKPLTGSFSEAIYNSMN